MAYVDFDFYTTSYHGSVVPESDFERLSERASDFLDAITFDRLVDGLPSDERAAAKVKKAACAVSEKLYMLELAEKQAISAAAGGSSVGRSGDVTSGVVTSKSAGSESISYASFSETASGAKGWSAVYQAAGDPQKESKLLEDTARLYLSGVRNDEGDPLLYAGL